MPPVCMQRIFSDDSRVRGFAPPSSPNEIASAGSSLTTTASMFGLVIVFSRFLVGSPWIEALSAAALVGCGRRESIRYGSLFLCASTVLVLSPLFLDVRRLVPRPRILRLR